MIERTWIKVSGEWINLLAAKLIVDIDPGCRHIHLVGDPDDEYIVCDDGPGKGNVALIDVFLYDREIRRHGEPDPDPRC